MVPEQDLAAQTPEGRMAVHGSSVARRGLLPCTGPTSEPTSESGPRPDEGIFHREGQTPRDSFGLETSRVSSGFCGHFAQGILLSIQAGSDVF